MGSRARPQVGWCAPMSASITSPATFLTPVCREVRGVWGFDPSDPLVVRLVLWVPGRPMQPWYLSRELLGDAFLGPAGEGEAQVYVSSLGRLVMVLGSPGGECVLSCDSEQAWEFLLRTREVCPESVERRSVTAALDEFLAGIAKEAA